jgi:signal transduction histidine kinase/putative methionine-R-sulfoxide reductase with GAF domain
VLNSDISVVYVNKLAIKTFSASASEIANKGILHFIEKNEKQPVAEILETAARKNIEPMNSILNMVMLDGTKRSFVWHISSVKLLETEASHILLSGTDITDSGQVKDCGQPEFAVEILINSILRLAIEKISLERFLTSTLELLLMIPWIAKESKGCIFMIEEDPNVLVMKAHIGMDNYTVEMCSNVPLGKCLCGKVAVTKKTKFANCITNDHEFMASLDMKPHGHFCVPITSQDRLLGVLNIYLSENHVYDSKQAHFLTTIATAVNEAIERKVSEKSLESLLEIERLITRISGKFINIKSHETDDAISSILAEVGLFLEVDRTYIYLFSNSLSEVRLFHSWIRPEILPFTEGMKDLNPADFSYVVDKLKKYEIVDILDFEGFSAGSAFNKEELEQQLIKSMTLMPLILNNTLAGFFGLSSVRKKKRLSIQNISMLKLVSDLFCNALDRARLENQLIHSQKMETVGRLAGGVAHDLNNLITPIMGYSQVLKNTTDLSIKAPIEEIFECSQRALKLTKQLLAFSRKQRLNPQLGNVNALIEDSISFLRRTIGDGIEILFMPYSSKLQVVIDYTQFDQVLSNIVINARDAMPGGGKITIRTARPSFKNDQMDDNATVLSGEFAQITITDTGTGMSNEVKSHIFEPFFTTKEKGKGTGLGLATCYGIVNQSGGHIFVASKPDSGTTFKILLPLVR